jgi:hypothetical protein
MKDDYERIDPEDRDSILWLQLVMSKLYPGIGSIVHIGVISPLTDKALRFYQMKHNLPLTGEPDEATMAQIRRELKERNIKP